MKKTFYLLFMGALAVCNTTRAQEVLPEGMTAISNPSTLQLTTVDDVNRAKCTKPMVKLPDGSLVFTATSAATGEELYICKNDQINLIKDIVEGSEGSDPKWLTVVGNKVYFSAKTPDYGEELWVTDGTPEGTKLVKDIYEGTDDSYLFGLTALGDKCLFFARDFDSELEPVIDLQAPEEWLWISDGTEAGTIRLADVPTRKGIDGMSGFIVPCGNQAFFIGYDMVNNETLWVTDGTAAGTKAITNINPKAATGGNFQTQPANIDWLTNVNNERVIFRAATVKEKVGGDSDYGNEIWYSDGTEAGTKWVGVDYAAGEADGVPNNTEFAFPIYYNGKVYFRAKDGVHGCEPGVTDFTPEGTHYISDINVWDNDPMSDSWGPEFPYIWKGYLFCRANGSYYYPEDTYNDSGFSVWRYNLAEGGETPTEANGLTGFQYQSNWTNGVEIFPGNNSDTPSWFIACGGRLFFRAQDADPNLELWKMEAVDATPEKVMDLEGNTAPHHLTTIGTALYFVTTTTKALYKYAPEPLEIEDGVENVTGTPGTFFIYPNPAVNTVEISSEFEITGIEIMDLTGKCVLSQQGSEKRINVSVLNSGLYILRAKATNGQMMSAKLTK